MYFDHVLKIITKLHACEMLVQNDNNKKHFKTSQKRLYSFLILTIQWQHQEIREQTAPTSAFSNYFLKVKNE